MHASFWHKPWARKEFTYYPELFKLAHVKANCIEGWRHWQNNVTTLILLYGVDMAVILIVNRTSRHRINSLPTFESINRSFAERTPTQHGRKWKGDAAISRSRRKYLVMAHLSKFVLTHLWNPNPYVCHKNVMGSFVPERESERERRQRERTRRNPAGQQDFFIFCLYCRTELK